MLQFYDQLASFVCHIFIWFPLQLALYLCKKLGITLDLFSLLYHTFFGVFVISQIDGFAHIQMIGVLVPAMYNK